MSRFYTGDELGKIKLIECNKQEGEWKLEERVAYTPLSHTRFVAGETKANEIKSQATQKLTLAIISEHSVFAAARQNGTVSTFSTKDDGIGLEVLTEWKDSRFKDGHSFVGLNGNSKGLFWCTSNGALGFASVEGEKFSSSFQKAALPMRLESWCLSPVGETFAYGGEEVDLSVWDTARAFQSSQGAKDGVESSEKKRKRGNELLPGEIWRAKNLPNDSLSLRQPVHIKSLTYLPTCSSSSAQIVTGTETGDVRRYDTRAARRPVANWSGIGKVGGVGVVQSGAHEHELFVSDNGTNLTALDLRNGRILYSYKKLQGAITSISPFSSSNPGLLGSTCRDRYFRLHSTHLPPKTAGQQQDERGEVLGSLYMQSVPTAVLAMPLDDSRMKDSEINDDEDEVWAGMEDADESDGVVDVSTSERKRKRKADKQKV